MKNVRNAKIKLFRNRMENCDTESWKSVNFIAPLNCWIIGINESLDRY